MSNFTVTGPGARKPKWAGPTIAPPAQGNNNIINNSNNNAERVRSTSSGRQRHYGSVELALSGEKVSIDDIVAVKVSSGPPKTALAQVQSMWEDTFTGVYKFRARWLIRAQDLPEKASTRLKELRVPHASRKNGKSCSDKTTSEPKASAGDENDLDGEVEHDGVHLKNEVFLSTKTEELEVRVITKPIVIAVKGSGLEGEAGVTKKRRPAKGKDSRPLLTHTYSSATGEFSEISESDPVVVRARIRQTEADTTKSMEVDSDPEDDENTASNTRSGKGKSDGWLRQKGSPNFATRGRGRGRGRHSGGGAGRASGTAVREHSGKARSSSQRSSLSSNDRDHEDNSSGDSDADAEPDPKDEAWEEGKDGVTDSDTDSERPSMSSRTRRSSTAKNTSVLVGADPEAVDREDDSSGPWKVARSRRSQRSPAMNNIKDEEVPSATAKSPTPDGNAHSQSQRRPRAPASKRHGPLPTRPRRLALPPGPPFPNIPGEDTSAAPSVPSASNSTISRTLPMMTRLNAGSKGKAPAKESASASGGSADSSTSGKRKRSGTGKTIGQSDYPPLRTPVGKEFQAEIPDLLSGDLREAAPVGTGTRMVWRSASHWDAGSKSMLAEYMRAAKAIVEVKQRRPGVAVHIRLGVTPGDVTDDKGSGGASNKTNGPDETGGSYAVWAITTERDANGEFQDVRVGCSENEQTEVPRSAIQRVSCEEEALTGLMRARCMLDNFKPALEMFAKDGRSPQSIQPWTFTQVRTLEKALRDDYNPGRHTHTWARPGIDMDREDFIDLAKVSKQVPGKTPLQVLAFYYKYLAAADPLTDVVFGPEGAEDRRREPIVPMSDSATAAPSQYGRPTRNNANPRSNGGPAGQGQVGSQSSQSQHSGPRGSSSAGGAKVEPDEKDDVDSPTGKQSAGMRVRLTAPRPVGEGAGRDGATDMHNVKKLREQQRGDVPQRGDPGHGTGASADLNATTGGQMRGPSRVGPGAIRSGYPFGGRSGPVDRSYRNWNPPAREDWGPGHGDARYDAEGAGWRGERGDEDDHPGLQRRRSSREAGPPRATPPDAEVLEVLDDESGDESHARGGGGDPDALMRHPNAPARAGGTAAALHWGLVGAGAGSWNSRQQMHRQQAEEAAAAASVQRQPSGILSIPPRSGSSAAMHGGQDQGHVGQADHPGRSNTPTTSQLSRGSAQPHHPSYPPSHHQHYSQQPYGYRREPPPHAAAGTYNSEERGMPGRWERGPQGPPPSAAYSRVPPGDEGAMYPGSSRGRGAPGSGVPLDGSGSWAPRGSSVRDGGGSGYSSGDSRAGGASPGDAQFGAMAPCWRLLERASKYMETNQLAYMKGLILTHVKKPMTRQQLLERAQSCLQEQDKIFDAFVKMFDRIEEPPMVPFYSFSSSKNSSAPPSDTASNGVPHHQQAHSYDGGYGSAGHHHPQRSHPRSPEAPHPHGYPESAGGGSSATLQVPLPPQLAVEVTGGNLRHPHTHALPNSGGRVMSSMAAPPGRSAAYAQPHPRSAISHASGAVSSSGRWAGSGGNSAPPGPRRSPSVSHPGPRGPGPASYSPNMHPAGPPGGGPSGSSAAISGGAGIPSAAGRSRREMRYVGPPPSRSGWTPAEIEDGRSATETAAAAAADSPRQRPHPAYSGARYGPPHGGPHGAQRAPVGPPQQHAQWRTDDRNVSSAAAAAATEAASSRGGVPRRSPPRDVGNPGGRWSR